jgi:hypothetical protein
MRTIHKATVGVAGEGLEKVDSQSALQIHATQNVLKQRSDQRPTR